jgi:hypothetical protein
MWLSFVGLEIFLQALSRSTKRRLIKACVLFGEHVLVARQM